MPVDGGADVHSMYAPLPALGLPTEALQSLRSAFAREVAARLPRLLTVVREVDSPGPLALARTDATMLAEGCSLLGDAAGARALNRLAELLEHSTDDAGQDREHRLEAASAAALLLGGWIEHRRSDP